MGAVFQAHHELMDKPVALKWLHPEHSTGSHANERFVREARAAARIQNPNVVQVYDVGSHEGALFMVMELLEGENVAELLARGPLSVNHALRLLVGAMQGVAAAHDHGILHRDIKPENIFIARSRAHPEGVAKILDFGVSKLMDERHGTRVTLAGQAVGTPEYMSCEQMNGGPDVDERTDVYAFGVLMYQALTGQTPYGGESLAAVAVQVATGTPTAPRALRPELPPAVETLILKAMARRREDRFPSMLGLIAAVEAVRASGDSARPVATPAREGSASLPVPQFLARRTRWLIRGAATAVGMALAVGFSAALLRSQPEPTVTPTGTSRAPIAIPAPAGRAHANPPAPLGSAVLPPATTDAPARPKARASVAPPKPHGKRPSGAAERSNAAGLPPSAATAPAAAVRASATANGRRSGVLSNTDF